MGNQKHLYPFPDGKELKKLLERIKQTNGVEMNVFPIDLGILPEKLTQHVMIMGRPSAGKSQT